MPLESRLLSLGGDRVLWQEEPEPHLDALLERGKVFTQRVKVRRGRPGRCHARAASLWGRDIKRYQLVTGYVLRQGVWLQHSWVVDERRLYDTAPAGETYFGVALGEQEALKFWQEHFLIALYSGTLNIFFNEVIPDEWPTDSKKPPGLWGPLTRRLLGIAGSRVSKQGGDPHLSDLVARGRLFDSPVKMRLGLPNRCHENSAAIWGRGVGRYELVTGYGLCDDGVWRWHYWVADGDRILETTAERVRYFGVVLTPAQAGNVWASWFLCGRYAGPVGLMGQLQASQQASAG